jgi:hypothetical protein
MKYRLLQLLLVIITFSCSEKSTGIVPDTKEPVNKPEHLLSKKKGACFTTKNETWSAKVSALKVYWHYSWGVDAPAEPDSVRFVPMIWGKWSLEKSLLKVDSLAKAGKVQHLLGFNEPDGKEQANLTVEESLSYWPKLMALNIPLGSPACVHADNAWMKEFMAKAEEKGYRVDFICVHWYGGANAQSLIDHLKSIHNLYNRPIWITEFAPADWSATSPATSKVTKAMALTFMQQILPALEKIDYVERYSWFSADPANAALGNSALFDNAGKLTQLGEFYSKFGIL